MNEVGLVGGDMVKLHHILLRIKSAGKTIFLYKLCDKIEIVTQHVACQNKNKLAHASLRSPHMMLFGVAVAWQKIG